MARNRPLRGSSFPRLRSLLPALVSPASCSSLAGAADRSGNALFPAATATNRGPAPLSARASPARGAWPSHLFPAGSSTVAQPALLCICGGTRFPSGLLTAPFSLPPKAVSPPHRTHNLPRPRTPPEPATPPAQSHLKTALPYRNVHAPHRRYPNSSATSTLRSTHNDGIGIEAILSVRPRRPRTLIAAPWTHG